MNSIRIDLGHVARDLNLPAPSVERTVALLDEGNTVPFITRYRKDQTGGLDEEQIRSIQWVVTKLRQLADRKQTIDDVFGVRRFRAHRLQVVLRDGRREQPAAHMRFHVREDAAL